MKSYDRPFLFVTHDEEFINNIANSLLIIKDERITGFKGNLLQYKERKNKFNKSDNTDKFLRDFRLSTINSRLAMDISKAEREKLEEEYKKLLKKQDES